MAEYLEKAEEYGDSLSEGVVAGTEETASGLAKQELPPANLEEESPVEEAQDEPKPDTPEKPPRRGHRG